MSRTQSQIVAFILSVMKPSTIVKQKYDRMYNKMIYPPRPKKTSHLSFAKYIFDQ
jgi:hypothetical protein